MFRLRPLHSSPTRTWLRPLLASLALVATACAGGSPSGDGGAGTCTTDLDCDDGHACTLDSCRVDMTCRHDAIDERCDMGLTCEVGRGCVSTASCTSDEQCDDTFACTIDSCGVGGLCGHTPVSERCTTAGEVCMLDMGCVAPAGCSASSECDDSIACTMDSCSADRTCSNTPLNELCNEAAGERCSPTAGCFTPMSCSSDAECAGMGTFCEGTWVCDPEFGCEAPAAPRSCDDSDDCTIDTCDATADACTFTCDTSRPECMCPVAGPSCEGRFRITPSIVENCVLGMVNYNLSELTFVRAGGVLQVTPTAAHFPSLGDTMGSVCPEFVATAEVPGGTTETYTLTGTFTDDDNFTGTWTSRFTDASGSDVDVTLLGCRYTGTTPVTGTRIP